MLWRQTLTRIDPTWHEHTTLAEDTLAQLVKWQRLWHTAPKSMACSIKDAARLHLACSRLEKSSELMWMASMTLSYSAEFEAQWLEQEAAALTCAIVLESERLGHVPATLKRKESERGLATPGVAPRKKGRDAFALFCSTINALASTRVQFAKPAVQDEKGMQREIEWASRTALNGSPELRLKSEVESQVESQRLMECLKAQKESLRGAKDYEVAKVEKQARADIQRAAEVYRKQAQEYILAAAAAERDRFEAEKAQAEVVARRRYAQVEREAREAAEACGICLNKPRNVVILPCSHGSYCSDCLARHGRINNTCPTCRTPIANLVRYIQ